LEVIPIEIDFILAIVVGALGMLLTLIYVSRLKDFNNGRFYKTNFIFVIMFSGITIIYDLIFGLTNIQTNGNSAYFTNSRFYERSFSINHAIIISTILIIGHLILTKHWK
jgi:hypothetical protein